MAERIQRIVKGVKIPDTVQEGIKEALEKQNAIDKIQTTGHRASGSLDARKTIEAGKEEIQKKIEKEYKRKFLNTQQAKDSCPAKVAG